MDILQDLIRPFMPKPNLLYPTRIDSRGDHVNVISDLQRDLLPGDVLLFRVFDKNDFLGNVVSHITDSPYSHAEWHIEHGYAISADAGGVGYEDVINQTNHLDVLRLNRPLTEDEYIGMKVAALKAIGLPYNYLNLAAFEYLSEEEALQMSGGQSFMCSQLVSWLFLQKNIQLITGQSTAKQSPCDLGRSAILNYIGTYVYMVEKLRAIGETKIWKIMIMLSQISLPTLWIYFQKRTNSIRAWPNEMTF
jgi:hypothetical protein